MLQSLYEIPFHILVPPNIKLRMQIPKPSPNFVFCCILVSYFLVTGGNRC